ncbi:MAG: hypothetical protein JWR37_4796 [Mycobacterium sp.]|nr:hypothetical protein [Mycobacterium sp.]
MADALKASREIRAQVDRLNDRYGHTLSERQIDILLAGGAINWRRQHRSHASRAATSGDTEQSNLRLDLSGEQPTPGAGES